jgi:hypothetical protein
MYLARLLGLVSTAAERGGDRVAREGLESLDSLPLMAHSQFVFGASRGVRRWYALNSTSVRLTRFCLPRFAHVHPRGGQIARAYLPEVHSSVTCRMHQPGGVCGGRALTAGITEL